MNIFKSITKYSDATIVQNRIEMDRIENEVSTLNCVPLILKFYFNVPISVHCPNILDIRTFLGCITLSVIIL